MLPSRLLCLLLLPVRVWTGVVVSVVRGVDDGSGAGTNVDVVAHRVLLRIEGSIGARSAADERRRISECEAMSRCLFIALDNE